MIPQTRSKSTQSPQKATGLVLPTTYEMVSGVLNLAYTATELPSNILIPIQAGI